MSQLRFWWRPGTVQPVCHVSGSGLQGLYHLCLDVSAIPVSELSETAANVQALKLRAGPRFWIESTLCPPFPACTSVPLSSPTGSILQQHTDGVPAECIQERSTDHRVLLSKQSWLQGSHLLPRTHFPPQMRHYQLLFKREWAQPRAGAVLGSMNSPSKGLCPLFALSQFDRDSIFSALRAKAGDTQPQEGQAHSLLCHEQKVLLRVMTKLLANIFSFQCALNPVSPVQP